MRKSLLLILLCLGITGAAFAQNQVSGKVIDAETGEPIIGAAVIVENTATGVSTLIDGTYSIAIPASAGDKPSLRFMFLGYEDVVVPVAPNQTVVNVKMKNASEVIEDVVVTGFKNAKKETFTGSSVKISADDIKIAGVSDVSRMLEGQVAGVSVQNVSSTFGAAPKVRIRGVTSLSGENKPLWVVDGVVLEDVVNISNDQLSSGDPSTLLGSSVAGINASDIETFDILKDAAATALYGARAMNVVVVITTKKGKAGAPRVTYTGNFTIRTKPRYSNYDILNSADQMSIVSEMERKGLFNQDILNSSNYGPFGLMWRAISTVNPETNRFYLENTPEARHDFLMKYARANTDWFDLLFTHNVQQEHTVSISTGTEKSSTYASIGFLHDGGWSIADEVSRYTLNFRNDYTVSDKISVGLQAVASLRMQDAPGAYSRNVNTVTGEWSREFDINPFSYALNTSRAVRPYDDAGNLEYVQMNYAPFNIFNELANNQIDLNVMDAKLQGEFNWNIVEGLKFNFTGALRYVKSDQVHKITEDSNVANAYRANGNSTIAQRNPYLWHNSEDPTAEPIVVLPLGGFYNTENNTLLNYDVRPSFNYSKMWDNGHRVHELNALAGMQIKYTDRTYQMAIQPGYQYKMGGVVNNDPNFYRMMADRQTELYSSQDLRDRFVAFYANADYSFDRRYSLSATVRYDGTNALGAASDKRWTPTWNFGAKWNAQNESFLQDVKWLDVLSFRVSYGLTASMPPASSVAAVYYNEQSYAPGYQENQIYIASLANKELTWEKSYQFNAGFDITMFDNRLNFSFDYFNRKNFDLISTIKVSGIGGSYWKYANYADLDTSGFDIMLGGTFIRTKNVTWTASLTLGYTENEIRNAKNLAQTFDLVRNEGGQKEGYPVGSLFSVPYAGLDPNTGVPLFYNERGEITTNIDMQGTDTDYLVYEGSVDPKVSGGLNTSLRIKNFSFNALFTYQAGNVIRLDPVFSSSYSDLDALTSEFKSRYVMAGDSQIPAISDFVHQTLSASDGYPYSTYNYTSPRVAKGDFIRLKSLTFRYDFSSEWVSKSRFFKTASLGLTIKDPWLIYSDKALNGRDPEFYNTGGVAMPTTTQFTLSLNLGF